MKILILALLMSCFTAICGESVWEETTVYGGKTRNGQVRIVKTVINSHRREDGKSVKRQAVTTVVAVKDKDGWKETVHVKTGEVDKIKSVKMSNKIAREIANEQEDSSSEE